MLILGLNSGSSSIKARIIDMPSEKELLYFNIQKIGEPGSKIVVRKPEGEETVPQKITDFESGLRLILESALSVMPNLRERLGAISHRVVHIARYYDSHQIVTPEVMEKIERCCELAPLHNPYNLLGIKLSQKYFPGIPQVAIFGNLFHANMPEYAYVYGLPYKFYSRYGFRKYGFHGMTFQYMVETASRLIKKSPKRLKMVLLMLGSGSTVCAYCRGKSIDVSTGYTPVEGVLQSTRSGDLDPGTITYILKHSKSTPQELDDILHNKSGLLGISGVSKDIREIMKAAKRGNKRAELALNIYCYRIKKYIGAYIAAMGGLNAIVFAGGIGENAPPVREKILSGLGFLGVRLSRNRNLRNRPDSLISTRDSKVAVIVVATNEELMLARIAYRLLQTSATNKK
ncbi:acetate/propionate family kinase [Candidatus Sumerlaeota bacterium]|nr:acetate/propionate family kinase [Candidatus Sumerlaeota bacterium]